MTDIMTAVYPWTKALHIVSMVAWMAGLFYMPRIFVYHAERGGESGEISEVFKVMEAKLLRLIMTPAMISTWVFGITLSATPGLIGWGQDFWIYLKIMAVLGLTLVPPLAALRGKTSRGTPIRAPDARSE